MTAALHSFETLFDQSPHVVAHASGVVALAGDLSDGRPTLAIAAPLATHVLVARRRDPVVHAASANIDGPARMVYVLGEESRWNAWVDHVQGATLALREAGHDLPGFDLLVRSDLPLGAGLGASTALVVALLRALREAYAFGFDDAELAAIAHRAESVFEASSTRAAADACVLTSERAAVLVGMASPERIALPDDIETMLLLPRERASRAPAVATPELEALRVDELAAAMRGGDPEEIGALLDTLPAPRCPLLDEARRHPSVYGARCVKEAGAVLALVRRGEARSVHDAVVATGRDRAA